ncbi:MAG: TIGR03987 family protein [Candidatus Marinimicrobia bacterium]|jgi:uncharacterized repeat protein (TIGR03987 family)|nr:TIGR03987 family protein [Candidatus Neomarinimicrobiota bacterium]MBT3502738.1 TIGR03987 family protein [Candidatus Neomarinimicrobiota bacterium]MBT3839763.1 TIGR03987 family protein [Candidatus Neomarinimicrobiota bacterium]MBT3999528.1 TIGR03987 family protein [Candidatus Neomarinimicrobiota bacterium]MBT4283417.1 TIGR03987 family protein [Candidatus Neomarinimicrobiota bacterium]
MSLISLAVLYITIALIFYSIAVWSERFAGRLKYWHLAFFWLGLIADFIGTDYMRQIAGGIHLNLHGSTGLLAIFLMLIHTIWATVVLVRKDEKSILKFHEFSTIVWVIWLIPYLTGVIIGVLK